MYPPTASSPVGKAVPDVPTDEPRAARRREPTFVGDEVALVKGLRAGNPAALAALFDRYAPRVKGVLRRVLGADSELGDALHDVFAEALASLDRLADERAIGAWLTSIAVFTARGLIRRRQRRRWLRLMAPWELPERPAPPRDVVLSEATRCCYAALDRLPADERIAFSLRFIDGLELTEVAAACRCSLATIKRRLARARVLFAAEARKHAPLASWLDAESRPDQEGS
jgi:RNA polymerase sigma-70 factor (ECF subfamily)